MELSYPVTSRYGWRRRSDGSLQFHHGVDLNTPEPTPLWVPRGAIVRSRTDDVYGWFYDVIEVGGGWAWRWAHLSRRLFPDGAKVGAGELAAQTGGTPGHPGAGNSTGDHIHLELRQGGRLVDPMDYPRLVEACFNGGFEMTKDEIRDLLEQELGQALVRVGNQLDAQADQATDGTVKGVLARSGNAFKRAGAAVVKEGRE